MQSDFILLLTRMLHSFGVIDVGAGSNQLYNSYSPFPPAYLVAANVLLGLKANSADASLIDRMCEDGYRTIIKPPSVPG